MFTTCTARRERISLSTAGIGHRLWGEHRLLQYVFDIGITELLKLDETITRALVDEYFHNPIETAFFVHVVWTAAKYYSRLTRLRKDTRLELDVKKGLGNTISS